MALNPQNLKPFTKGDPRINRGGRPKDSQSLSALVRRIGHEKATTKDGTPLLGPDGKPMTVIEAVIRQRFQDKRYQGEMIDRGWGKVPQPVDVQGEITGEIVITWHDSESED